MKHGKGKYRFGTQGVYEGQWVADQMEGYGVFTWKNGTVYKGFFKNSQK